MQLLADLYNCTDFSPSFSLGQQAFSGGAEVDEAVGLVLVSLFSWDDFDADDLVRRMIDLYGAESADYQVLQRSARIHSPRPGPSAPWLHVGRPRG